MINVEESQILKNTITNPLNFVRGAEVLIGGENFYKISNVDKMPPFFISLISNSNHWLFISSNGGLTAGRKDSSNAFFPYYTDDKITQSIEHTGSKTIFRIGKANSDFLWEPFSIRQERSFKYSRNLYKNTLGNKIIFEEINHDLNLSFTYQWNSSDTFGFVRHSALTNLGDTAIIEVDAFLGEKYKGLVSEIANSANVTGASADQVTNFEVKVRIIKAVNFRPGMTATVDIQSQRAKDVLALPIQAVTTRKDTAGGDEKIECVFEYQEGIAKMIVVQTGIQDDEYIQILSGVKDSMEIVKGPYSAVSRLIKDGSYLAKADGSYESKGSSISISVN